MKYWRVGALKVAKEEGSNLLSSKEVTMAAKPQHKTERVIPVWYLLKNVWEEGREKQANKLAEQTPAKAHDNALADLPGPPNFALISFSLIYFRHLFASWYIEVVRIK